MECLRLTGPARRGPGLPVRTREGARLGAPEARGGSDGAMLAVSGGARPLAPLVSRRAR